MWYEVEYARSGRSECKEFRCSTCLDKGELRIGLMQDENDHMGQCLGWYCFRDVTDPCLWKTFRYKKKSNPPILRINDVVGFSSLTVSDQERIMAIVDKGGSSQAPPPAKRARLSSTLPSSVQQPTYLESQFSEKDEVKALGAKWNRERKQWFVPAGTALAPFAKWIDPEAVASVVASSANNTVEKSSIVDADATTVLSLPETSSKLVFLNTKFAEKNEAKVLGALWDRQQSSWYVPAGIALAPFTKWISPEAASLAAQSASASSVTSEARCAPRCS